MTLRLDDFRQQQKPHTAPPPAKDTHTHTQTRVRTDTYTRRTKHTDIHKQRHSLWIAPTHTHTHQL